MTDFQTWWDREVPAKIRSGNTAIVNITNRRLAHQAWRAAVEATKAACVEAVLNSDKIVHELEMCPECEQNKSDGMDFCAFCGRNLTGVGAP